MSQPDIRITDEDPKVRFSQEIVTQNFYAAEDDIEIQEFEVAPTPSFAETLEAEKKFPKKKFDDTEIIQEQQNEIQDETNENDIQDETPENEIQDKGIDKENLSDFFEQPPPEDEEKKKVIESISGMTEVSEDQQEEFPYVRASVQFKNIEHFVEKEQEQSNIPLETQDVKRTSKTDTGRKVSTAGTRISEGGSRPASARSSGIDTRKSEGEALEPYAGTMIKDYDRKGTILSYVEFGPRFRGIKETDDDDLMGFDMTGDAAIFFDEVEEEEEEVVEEEEEQMAVLDRKPYYERHYQAFEELSDRKIRNFILQKKLTIYYKRKKMDYVTKETEWSFDQQNKYFRKLEAYGELMEFDTQQRFSVNTDMETTKKLKEDKSKELKIMFKNMQSREGEIGYGLIHTKTGNPIPDKHVERLIHRQRIQMEQVSSMRLTYIKLRQMVQEKLDSIAALDEIAPGFLLADYEQLKSMNQSYADKIEEREEELTRLRAKCASTIQILAHLREKMAALDNDLVDLDEEREDTMQNYVDVRTQLNTLKQERDNTRRNINRIRAESGLLTQPLLLRDMEEGLRDFKDLSATLEHVIKDNRKRANQIKTIRKKIEEVMETRRVPRRSVSKVRSSRFRSLEKTKPTIYRGRPSLMIPEIADSAFDSLRSIKPQITFTRKRHGTRIKNTKSSEG